MPFYWLLISVAAYRALLQFMTARFEWEKTEHGLARSMEMRSIEMGGLATGRNGAADL